jgi:hypothetical protein
MAAVTQTAAAGAVLIGVAHRAADDSSDNKASGTYSHRDVEFSATEKAELTSRMMYYESIIMLRLHKEFN